MLSESGSRNTEYAGDIADKIRNTCNFAPLHSPSGLLSYWFFSKCLILSIQFLEHHFLEKRYGLVPWFLLIEIELKIKCSFGQVY